MQLHLSAMLNVETLISRFILLQVRFARQQYKTSYTVQYATYVSYVALQYKR
jgi:hypothetical protein